MLNHIVIMGRLTRDPELRYTQSQTPVASFTIAVDRDFGGRRRSREADRFHRLCGLASNRRVCSAKYFTKGSMAVVSGRLQAQRLDRSLMAENAVARRSLQTIFTSVKSRRRDWRGRRQAAAAPIIAMRHPRGQAALLLPAPSAFAELDDGDGELPF